MNKRVLTILLVMLLGVVLPTAVSQSILTAQSQPTAVMDTAVYDGVDINTTWHQGTGIVSYYNLGIFGQNICTAYGDPFSPLASPWAPGPYTYEFRIRIPADYPYQEVRVELFDPDSINAPNQGTFTIPRTNAAIEAGLEPTTTGSCNLGQKDSCLISTGELELWDDGDLELDQINPYFFWRIDENRGTGPVPGDGGCGQPGSYDAAYNSRTHFELYYFQSVGETITRTTLASYTGQTGDGVRDSGGHLTDLYWVSPGAPTSFDQLTTTVPVDAGSPATFQVDLTDDTPNLIVDPTTGDRYLNLAITALEGGSENGFDIWAGPPHYIDYVPSEVNARNLYVLNTPGSHSARGVEVSAVDNLPLNSNANFALDMPLVYVGPEYAGQTFTVSIFDTDNGAQPPITFYFDTIAEADWSLTFAQNGVPDPDGQTRNCEPGNCNNQWVDPPYQIMVPGGNLDDCDHSDPSDMDCIPFYGGWLMVEYTGGFTDLSVWQINGPTEPPSTFDPGDGCSAFPITIHEGTRSVTAPGSGGNPYPNAAEFDYPVSPPEYLDFADHTPDTPLQEASAGDVFKLQDGFGEGNFGWLVWNEYVNNSAGTLENSLTWPGNSQDYTTVAAGQVPPGFAHPVYGYIEAGDPSDTDMHIGDWVAAYGGAANSAGIQTVLNGHIDNGRTLRLPIWDTNDDQGANGRYQISGFGLFKLVGYNLESSSGSTWLLFEFMGHDASCGQPEVDVSPTAVTITGPSTGMTNTTYAFTATVSPISTTLPITYVWAVDSQPVVTQTNGLTDTFSMSWGMDGSYEVHVTAVNSSGDSVTDTHTIHIGNLEERFIYLPVIVTNELDD